MRARQIILVLMLASAVCLRHANAQTLKTLSGKNLRIRELDNFLNTQMKALGVPGLSIAVINDARVVYYRTLGVSNIETQQKVSEDTLFDAGSMSKTPFAFLVMKMVEQGTLSLDEPLYKYLPNPDLANDDRSKMITARMVLSHTSGLPNWRFLNPGGKLDIKFTPGTQYLYSGEGFEYLATVLAHLKGIQKNDLQNVFESEVATPIGMSDAYYVWNDYVAKHQAQGHIDGKIAKGWGLSAERPNFAASYSLQTEAKSYSKFLIAMIKSEGLKKETYAAMLKPQIKMPDHDAWYALGIMVNASKFGTEYTHDGYNLNFSSQFMFNQKHKFGYVFFTNCNKGAALNDRLETVLAR